MQDVKNRISALRNFFKAKSGTDTVFIADDGTEYRTRDDPFEYLRVYGAYTHDGRRIVRFPHPIEGIDPLSISLYEMLDEAIERGKLELPALESDEIGGKALE